MKTRKTIMILLILSFLIINISAVYSSWYDWSRYEQDGYSFEIPDGFHYAIGPGSDDNEYLVDEAGGKYTDFGSNRISIHIGGGNWLYENATLILKYNDTLDFYNTGNSTLGVYKTDNGTNITIHIYCWHDRIYDNQRAEMDVDILKTMFDSVRVD